MIIAAVGLVIVIVLFAIWGAFALYFQGKRHLRWVLVATWLTLSLAAIYALFFGLSSVFLIYKITTATLLIWWAFIPAKLDREWQPALARTVTGVINDDHVQLENVRNFKWLNAEDAEQSWEARDYDLTKLRTLDVFLSYWDSPNIAHVLVSFGFEEGDYITFSVEIRKAMGQSFSTLGGFFKVFELAFIAATETDIVKLRTNVRDPIEDVYLYPLKTSKEDRIALFTAYVNRANKLAGKARFYNTVTANCTTVVYQLIKQFRKDVQFHPSIILSGQLPELFARRGFLDWEQPHGDIRKRAAITKKAQLIGDEDNFSAKIRET